MAAWRSAIAPGRATAVDLNAPSSASSCTTPKPYDKSATESHRKAGQELARRMRTFVSSMPFYQNVDGFIAVPSSNPGKAFSLPAWIRA